METEANDIFPTGVWKINKNFLVIIHCIHRIAFPAQCNHMDRLEPTGIQESDRIGSDLKEAAWPISLDAFSKAGQKSEKQICP